MSPADIGLRILLGLSFFLAFLHCVFIKPCPHHRHRLRPVTMLRAVVLALHHDTRRNMGQTHRAVGLVNMLPTRTRRAIGVDSQILILDLNLDRVVDYRIDPGGREARVSARLAVEGRNTN